MEGGEEWVRKTDAERRPLYASVADVTIDTDNCDPSAIAGRGDDQVAPVVCRAQRLNCGR